MEKKGKKMRERQILTRKGEGRGVYFMRKAWLAG
jgi:hypothetical protein